MSSLLFDIPKILRRLYVQALIGIVSGITGSSFIILGSTLAILKIILVEGIVLLVGIDRITSEGWAITTS